MYSCFPTSVEAIPLLFVRSVLSILCSTLVSEVPLKETCARE